jgi:hypothetical protein
VLFLVVFACKSKINSEIEQMVKFWTGKSVIFPEHLKPVYPIKDDTVKYAIDENINKKYKILFYVDSTGCTSCKLHLHLWKMYIKELSSTIDFKFYFYPKTEEGLLFLLNKERFAYPVYIDSNDDLNKLNRFPNSPAFQCFLLDKNNKILAIGNPATNYKVLELYKKIITGEASDKLPVTIIESKQTEIELNDLYLGKTSEAVFVLKNTGTNPLVIQQVESSCGCTVPKWEKQPIVAGNSTEIKVKITPEKNEYFNKTVTVYCNTEKGKILFTLKGIVNK